MATPSYPKWRAGVEPVNTAQFVSRCGINEDVEDFAHTPGQMDADFPADLEEFAQGAVDTGHFTASQKEAGPRRPQPATGGVQG